MQAALSKKYLQRRKRISLWLTRFVFALLRSCSILWDHAQTYIDVNRDLTTEILQKVERLGAKAIIFTVDVGWWSKRTLETRHGGELPKASLGAFMAMGGRQDRNLSWNDISWIRVRILCFSGPLLRLN